MIVVLFQTPLHLAVKLDFAAAVRALLAAGADVNLVDKTGCTSLHLAVKHQLGAGLRRLCELSSTVKPDLNARNFDGQYYRVMMFTCFDVYMF